MITASFIVYLYIICTIGCIIHLYRKKIIASSEADVYRATLGIIVKWAICPTILAVLYCLNGIVSSKFYKTLADAGEIFFLVFIGIPMICGTIWSLIRKGRKENTDKH